MTDSSASGPGRQLIYIADPMCSWCWGFSPVIDRVAAEYADRSQVVLVLGGLRPDNTAPLDAGTKATIRGHWDHVNEASGQPFDYAFFDRESFVYNTEPSCRAVVTARRIRPRSDLGFLAHLHRAFYAQNRDITDADTLCDLAADFGYGRDAFSAEFESREAAADTRKDFALAVELGIRGFPALIAADPTGLQAITVGYRPWEAVSEQIDRWLETEIA